MEGPEGLNREEATKLFQAAYERQMEGNLAEAISLYRKSIEVCPMAESHTYLGWSYSLNRDYSKAIEECRKAIEVDPEYGNPYNDIGAYLIELGEFDEALPWLKKAVRAKRYESYCYPHYNMGRIWEQKGDWKRALTCYENSLHENSDYTLAKKAVNRLLAAFN